MHIMKRLCSLYTEKDPMAHEYMPIEVVGANGRVLKFRHLCIYPTTTNQPYYNQLVTSIFCCSVFVTGYGLQAPLNPPEGGSLPPFGGTKGGY
jgi:hypothetical protein